MRRAEAVLRLAVLHLNCSQEQFRCIELNGRPPGNLKWETFAASHTSLLTLGTQHVGMRRCALCSDHSCGAAGRQAQQLGVQQTAAAAASEFWHFATGTHPDAQTWTACSQAGSRSPQCPPTGSANVSQQDQTAGLSLDRTRTPASAALSRKGADACIRKSHENASLQQCTSTALAGLRAVVHLRPPPAAHPPRHRAHTPHGCASPRLSSSSMLAHKPPAPAPQTDS
jgi:hypothetical protein